MQYVTLIQYIELTNKVAVLRTVLFQFVPRHDSYQTKQSCLMPISFFMVCLDKRGNSVIELDGMVHGSK